MSVYTVHEPPQSKSGVSAPPERMLFVRDGFYLWAFVLGPVWLLWRRLWLALLLYVLAWVAVEVLLIWLKAGAAVHAVVGLGLALLLGLEASSLWRWTLQRRGWKNLGVVVGEDLESAERRFFQSWSERSPSQPSPAAPSPPGPAVFAPPASASGVIGLFPEPGGPR